MARPLRVEYPGAFYHVINRGNHREKIFKSARDHEKFIQYLEKAAERFALIIHTYCLMGNHYHLLVETPEPNLSMTMQWLNVSYATYFNRRHNRSGHLFQGRFGAILIEADAYLHHLSRYIHLNPVRAGIVNAPEQYRWSSYPAIVGEQIPPKFLKTSWLLSNFGKNKEEARKSYREFVEGVDINTLKDPSKKLAGGFILGDTDFVNWVKETFLCKRDDEKEIPQLRKLKPRVAPEIIVEHVSEAFNIEVAKIQKKGSKRNKAREVAIYLGRELSRLSCNELGDFFGGVSGALITMMNRRITQEIDRNRQLKNKIEKIKDQIFNI
jgi:REP element-mobilizing transposase RayT